MITPWSELEMAISGQTAVSGGVGSLRCFARTPRNVSPVNGTAPVNISYMMIPTE